jgi:hypothetical protein
LVPTLVAGILLLAAPDSSLYWQAAGGSLCLVAGVGYAWILLVQILR